VHRGVITARAARATALGLVVAFALAGCAPSLLQAPPVAELRRHEGPNLPLKAHVLLELRKFEIRGGGPLHTREILAPSEGVQLARDLVREKIAESGLFESVEALAGGPSADPRGVVFRGAIDIVVTTPAWGVTSFNPHIYLTATHVGPGGVREALFSGAHYETRGTMGDNVFALRDTVMLAWRTGGETLATLIANDLPRRIGASALGARLAGRPPAAPAPPPRAEARAPVASSGSGFLLKNTNLVLTNYHVVQDKAEITLVFPSGEEYRGQVVFRDRSNDLALVEARGLGATARGLVVATGVEVRVGETVHALGYPLGAGLSRKPSMVSGAISSTVGLDDDIARFRTTAPINPGNSGGPIVNQRGQVIGIAAAGLLRQDVEAIRFGIKAATAALILQQARLTTALDVVVAPAGSPATSPDRIFDELSPSVVLIEAR
jgi:hypothetical protein